MPLHVVTRRDTGTLQIAGTVELPDGTKLRVRQRPQSDQRQLATEEATLLEARLLRDAWLGERRGSRPFAEAVVGYLGAAPRRPMQVKRLKRVMLALGDVLLSQVDQAALNAASQAMFTRCTPAPQTVTRELVTPVMTIMQYAHRQGWCDLPTFERPKQPQGRTRYLLPVEAHRLIDAAAPHLKPLLVFMLSTGARLSEATELEWRDVDLEGQRVIFWRTKGGKRRIAHLPPAAVNALAALPHRDGPVFLYQRSRYQATAPKPYADRNREYGGQIKTAWRGARARAGIDPALTPHDLRHTWASWHYATGRDLLALKVEGGWSSVALVERYAHLLPAGQEAAIRMFWSGSDTLVTRTPTVVQLSA